MFNLLSGLVINPSGLGRLNVLALSFFRSAAQQDNYVFAVIGKIDPVAVVNCKRFPFKLQNLEISNCKNSEFEDLETCKSSPFKLQNLI
jgi:hypothetical protein